MYDELIKDLRENHDKYFARDMQAADAIEELQGELQALKDDTDMAIVEDGKTTKLCFVKKWIPVTERLPETHDYVLCCGAKGGMFVGYVSCFTEPQGFAWAWQHGGQGRKIKWWMPLPQPPESEDE